MKISQKMIRNLGILLTGVALGMTSACSSSQQDEEDLELSGEDSANQQGNLGEDDASEGNGQENYVDGNQYEENNEQGADTNSDTENEFADENQSTAYNEMNPTLDNSAGNTAMAAPEPMEPASMAAPASSEKSPIPGGRVRYVRQGGVQVVSGPGGAPVASLEQGDHPVTWEENGWLRLSTGMYVPVDSLSDKGVGRPMSGNGWN